MRLMLTRAKADAAETLDRLNDAGHAVLHEPLLTILPGPDATAVASVVLDSVQALLATSSNGVRAMASWPDALRLPLFAVGDATARTARELGFTQVESADGDVGALVTLVKSKLKPAGGHLLHGAGTVRAGDLKTALEDVGFQVRRMALYRAETATGLTGPAVRFLEMPKPGGVLLYSPRTGKTFAALVKKAGLAGKLGHVTAYCLSEAVAAELAGVALGRTLVAAAPREDKLLALIDKDPLLLTEDNAAPADGAQKGNAMADQKPANQSATPKIAPKTAAKPAATSGGSGGKSAKAAAKPARQKKPGRLGWYTAGALALVIAGGAGTIAGLPYLPDAVTERLGLQSANEDVQALSQLERRLASVERQAARPQDNAANDQMIREFTTALGDLSGRVAALEAAPIATGGDPDAAAANSAALTAMQERLAAMEAAVATMAATIAATPEVAPIDQDALTAQMQDIAYAASAGRSAALLAQAALVRATVAGPFAVELAALEEAIGANEATIALAAYADDGVMSHARLKAGFDRLAREAVRAAMVPDDAPWYKRWFANALSIVTVRPVGDVPGSDVPARIARAEAALGDDDLAAAIDEVAAIDGAAAQLLNDWLTAAQARLAVDAALAHLRVQAMGVGPVGEAGAGS